VLDDMLEELLTDFASDKDSLSWEVAALPFLDLFFKIRKTFQGYK
jgi:hypothetical protein